MDRMQPRDAAVLGTGESLGRHGELAIAAFFVRRRHAKDVRPRGPRVLRRARVGRALEQLELAHAARALAVCRAEAVRARIAAADDNHVLVTGADRLDGIPLARAILRRQVFHGEMDALQLAPRHAQVARQGRSSGQHDRIEVPLQLPRVHVDADVAAGGERNALVAQQREAALEPALLDLEFRNAVAQQSANPIGALENGDQMAGAIQLVGGGQPRRSRSDDGDALAGAGRRRMRDDPALVEGALDNRGLGGLDRHRCAVDGEDARAFARRRAQPAGEFREVVGRVQPIDRGAPAIPIHEVVPIRNQVAERAALMAERNAAVHASSRLIPQRGCFVRQIHLAPVAHARLDGTRRRLLPLDLDKAGGFTHGPAPPRAATWPRWRACSRAA